MQALYKVLNIKANIQINIKNILTQSLKVWHLKGLWRTELGSGSLHHILTLKLFVPHSYPTPTMQNVLQLLYFGAATTTTTIHS